VMGLAIHRGCFHKAYPLSNVILLFYRRWNATTSIYLLLEMIRKKESKMQKNMIFGLALAMLLIMASVGIFRGDIAKGDIMSVTIWPSGEITPPDAPILTSDNVTYTLTGDINGTLNVLKSDVLIEGEGYIVNSQGASLAVVIDTGMGAYATNVSLHDLGITGASYGIYMGGAANCTVSGCRFWADGQAIWANSCPRQIKFCGNNITDCHSYPYGAIWFTGGTDCSIIGNYITESGYGISLWSVNNCTILGNIITNCNASAIGLGNGVWNCTVSGNNVTSNLGAAFVLGGYGACCNSISDNYASDNYYGLYEDTFTGKPTVNNTISNNDFIDNLWGVYDSHTNIGTIADSIYHNKFIENTHQVGPTSQNNTWDNGYPLGGNYWSDYAGVDYYSGQNQDEPGCDGIGDTQYNVSQSNSDRYPLMKNKNYDWPFRGYDPASTSLTLSKAPNTNAVAWLSTLSGGTGWAYPIVADGKVFIGDGGRLDAFDENTGGWLWSYRAQDQPGYPVVAAYANGRVFFGTAEPGPNGRIYALDARTGAELWSFGTEGYSREIVAVKDKLYFGVDVSGAQTGNLYCIDAITGAKIWSYPTQDSEINVAVAYNRVYAVCGHWETSTYGAAYCLDMNGNLIWSFQTGTDQCAGLAVKNGRVYFAASNEGWNCVIYALDAFSGFEVWRNTNHPDGNNGIVAVAYGKVFVALTYSGAGLYALNETNGNDIWFCPSGWLTGPVVADNKVFFAAGGSPNAHTVYAVSQETGVPVWSYELSGGVHSRSCAVAGGRLFVADHFDPHLYAFGPTYQGKRQNLAITTTTGGTTMPTPGNYSYSDGATVCARALPQTYYALDHWELDGLDIGQQDPVITMNQNHTLHAVFLTNATIRAYCYTEGTYTNVDITIDGSPSGYTTPHTFKINEPHTFTVPSTDLSGHPFKQWSNGETSTTITVALNGTYTAYYQAKYNLTIGETTGGTTSPITGNYTYWEGTKVNVTASPFLGYAHTDWKLDDVNIGSPFNPICLTMNKSCTLKAIFSWVGICNLTITSTEGGTLNPATGYHSYTNGTLVEISAIPSLGYTLDHWELDNVSIGQSNLIIANMNESHSVHAVFSWAGICNLTITATSGGTTLPTPGTYSYTNGTEQVTVNAIAGSSYVFDHWELDGNTYSGSSITVTMNQNHALTAVFRYVPPPPSGGGGGGCGHCYSYACQ